MSNCGFFLENKVPQSPHQSLYSTVTPCSWFKSWHFMVPCRPQNVFFTCSLLPANIYKHVHCWGCFPLASELWFNVLMSLLFLTWAQNTFPSPGTHRHPQYKQCSKIAGHQLKKRWNSTWWDGGVELCVLCFSPVPVFWSLSHSLGLKKPSQSSKVRGDPCWWLELDVSEGMEWGCLERFCCPGDKESLGLVGVT